MVELSCPKCGSICANVEVKKDGSRYGICRNLTCQLNQDGIGVIIETEGAVVSMSFPTGGPRLDQLTEILEGRALQESLPEDVSMLDGFTFCGECGAPIFSDGEQYYRHIQDLPRSRLRKLMKVRRFAEQVHKWLTTLDFTCPEHGRQPNPFVWELDKEKFCRYVATRAGARDLWLILKEVE